MKAFPVARRLAAAAVDDQIVGLFGHFRVEVVHQHSERRLLLPALAGEGCTSGRADERSAGRRVGDEFRHGLVKTALAAFFECVEWRVALLFVFCNLRRIPFDMVCRVETRILVQEFGRFGS